LSIVKKTVVVSEEDELLICRFVGKYECTNVGTYVGKYVHTYVHEGAN
jgi:hypothetical protein